MMRKSLIALAFWGATSAASAQGFRPDALQWGAGTVLSTDVMSVYRNGMWLRSTAGNVAAAASFPAAVQYTVAGTYVITKPTGTWTTADMYLIGGGGAGGSGALAAVGTQAQGGGAGGGATITHLGP